jgi:organic hydroperoxide reductase OsmC/OhrA
VVGSSAGQRAAPHCRKQFDGAVAGLNVDPDTTDPLARLPGELLAGAIGSVFTWLVAQQLVKEGTQARELVSSVTLTLSDEADGLTDAMLSGISCQMSVRIAGVEEAHLEVVAQAAAPAGARHTAIYIPPNRRYTY